MIQAYAAASAGTPLERFDYDPAPLGPHDVEVGITHCGLCHSDLHLVDGDWGRMPYPMVPGHEIVGVVASAGAGVAPGLVGRRVGIGWQRGSCLDCEYCLSGQEPQCDQSQDTCIGHHGGFARAIRLDHRFCHPIPDGLPSEAAAPLLCAGITVYAPLRRYGVDANSRVGVVGIGGLGHLAVQFADRMGAHVTAFSSGDAKREQAHELGADVYINSRDGGAMRTTRKSLDILVVTAPADLDWLEYLKALRPNGVLAFVAATSTPVPIPASLLIDRQLAVTGSSIGGRAVMREMLDFSARHAVRPWTETLPFAQVNTALERLRRNDVRYRFVLAWDA